MAIHTLGAIVIEKARALFRDPGFRANHRSDEKAFTRERALTFDLVMLFVLQKTAKSIQRHLHEFFGALAGTTIAQAVSPSAWTQARAKLKHTAFVELNQRAIVEPVYAEKQELKLWHGHRVLPVDSSVIRMPDCDELFEFFGGQEQVKNQKGPTGERIPQARLSVLYDCLNRIVLDARVGKYTQGERELLMEHLSAANPGDLLVLDRGYEGYLTFAELSKCGLHFVARCSRHSFSEADKLFERNEHGASITVELSAKRRQAQAKAAGLPLKLKVRFISLRLPSGELEVLVTSLVDESAYPTEEFGNVYDLRWGVETLYGLLKGRLELENFSGRTVESVLQDIHAAVFLTSLESVVTREAAECLPQVGEDGRRNCQQINRANSLHALKCKVMDLLIGSKPAEEVLAELTEIFLASRVSVRPDRTHPPRQETPRTRIINYLRRVRKIVF